MNGIFFLSVVIAFAVIVAVLHYVLNLSKWIQRWRRGWSDADEVNFRMKLEESRTLQAPMNLTKYEFNAMRATTNGEDIVLESDNVQ